MEESDIQSKYILSYYKKIATISKEHGILLVQHIKTGRTFVKKTADIHSKSVYETLKKMPVKGVPRTHEVCVLDGTLYIIEEQIAGKNLQEILDEKGTLTEKEVREVAMKLCDVLTRLHSLHPPIIHRDIKPSNVIITDDERVVLIDLDGAKKADYSAEKDTHMMGTPGYAAPEQFGFDSSKPQTDIYGVGKLMLVLLTGGTEKSKLKSGTLKKVIDKCLQMDPRQRYKTAKKLKSALFWSKRFLKPAAIIGALIILGMLGGNGETTDNTSVNSSVATEAEEAPTMGQSSVNAVQEGNVESQHYSTSASAFLFPQKDDSGNDQLSLIEESESSPIGTYRGDDDEQLIIAANGLAYYYCDNKTFTELECPWQKTGNVITITLSKMHCDIKAEIRDNNTQELIFKSDSKNWNSEVFEKISSKTELVSPPPTASKYVEVGTDGSMHFKFCSFNCTVPKQFRDMGEEANNSDNQFIFVDVNADTDYSASALFYTNPLEKSASLDTNHDSIGKTFSEQFMDNVEAGKAEQLQIGGKNAYKIAVSGTLNKGFNSLSNQRQTGHIYLVKNPSGNGIVYILLLQKPEDQINNSEAFDQIIASITCDQ